PGFTLIPLISTHLLCRTEVGIWEHDGAHDRTPERIREVLPHLLERGALRGVVLREVHRLFLSVRVCLLLCVGAVTPPLQAVLVHETLSITDGREVLRP